MQCPTCKQNLEDGIRFCPHDGTPLLDTSATRTDSTPTGGHRPSSRELQLPVVIGNRYRLEEMRGGGGMAKVYRAIDVTLEREVAVKLINPDLRNEAEFDTRFQREARIASQLADPHIVVVHDFGLDGTHGPYLVMEYLQGQSLREKLASSGAMPLKATLQLAGQLILALIHAHGKGIVHRDIKPDNIFLLNQSGVRLHTRVLDFGIARIYRAEDNGQTQTITNAGAVLGTPRYMSPEQLAGQSVDARSDLYSAALVIFESLTGQLPYVQGKRLCELCPEASQGLQDLLEQCLKPSPDERPPTAVEVYLRLQELGKASGILLLPPGAMDRIVASRKANESTVVYVPVDGARKRRKRWLLVGLGVLALLLGGLGLWAWLGGTSYDPNAPENLLGVRIGESKDEAEKILSRSYPLTKGEYPGNPWKLPRTRDHLGLVLQPADLGLTPAELNDLVTMRSADDRVSVIFFKDKVIGMVASHRRVSSGRGVTMFADAGQLLRRYDDQRFEVKELTFPGGGHGESRRFKALGIGFEVQNGRVTSMALFPAS